jgi:intraflagellar transport protein 122
MYAYQSKFVEAAKCFKKSGQDQLAMAMFTDLRMFEQAKEYLGNDVAGASSQDKTSIMLKQAEWALRNEDPKTAAELYMSAKQYNKVCGRIQSFALLFSFYI